jgi:xylan 1,4-beta-xylosidase
LPKDLSAEQLARMKELTRDLPETDRIVNASSNGTLDVTLPMNTNDVVLLTVKNIEMAATKQAR